MKQSHVPRLLSLIYVHNPFYLISACLFVYGLKLLYRAGDGSLLFQRGSVAYIQPWELLMALAGVTVLMGGTAVLIVRLGKVWEDARSLVLIVLLMLLAISVSMDEVINVLSDRDNSVQHLCLMFGLGATFAITVGELLVRGLPIRIGLGYRLPLYAFLVLFFIWPAALLREVTGASALQNRWLIAAFPWLSGLVTLTLIPAIRKGSAAVADNGTPWNWPLIPWTPFVFIALAVCFRSYSLTMSFDVLQSSGHYWDTAFGPYQLIPFLLAVYVILLEISITERLPKLQHGVLLTAPLLLLIAHPWLVPWSRLPGYAEFTVTFTRELASPVFLTVLGLALLYSWAWFRRVPYSKAGVSTMVLLATFLGPRSFAYPGWRLNPNEFLWWPVLAMATVQIISGLRHRKSLPTFVGCMLLIVAIFQTMPEFPALTSWRTFACLHLLLAAMLVIGLCLQDGFARWLNSISPGFVSLTALSGLVSLANKDCSLAVIVSYAAAFHVLPITLAWLLRSGAWFRVAILHSSISGMALFGAGVYGFLKVSLPAGAKPVMMAAGSFLVAVLISVLKSGLARRIRLYWLLKQRRNPA